MEKEKLKEIADFIRENSSNGKLTKQEDLYLEPINLSDNSIVETLQALTSDPEYNDIVQRKGKERSYMYSTKRMTENYADMVFRVEEKELLRLLVDTVRYESRIYPRPTTISLFSAKPFNFNEQQTQELLKQVIEKDEYSDILEIRASNGSLYLYSRKYMTKDHAVALTEWIEVEQYQTP